MSFMHITLDQQDDVVTITLDMAGKSANLLSQAVIAEIDEACDQIAAMADIALVMIRSAKPSGFVFGADITEFETLQDTKDVVRLQERAMAMLDKLESLEAVSVALLNGPALGGGLELALACDYRLGDEAARTMLGFPEVNLGLMPGFAGTARAARLLGAEAALSYCLSGKPIISASAALEAGILDGCCEATAFEVTARTLATKGKRQFVKGSNPIDQKVVDSARQALRAKQRDAAIPHALRICDHFEAALSADNFYQCLVEGELHHFPILMLSEESKAMRHLFAINDKVKKQGRGDPEVSKIAVIGAGTMGADIATFLCFKGFDTYLSDIHQPALRAAKERAQAYFVRKLSDEKAEAAAARFHIAPDDAQLATCDIIIEAAPEKLGLKQDIWAKLEQIAGKEAVLATNTSALDLTAIAAKMAQPHRLLGVHFFNPATVMPLVEIVTTQDSDDATITRLIKLMTKIGKMPVPVRNSPGFIVNRALLPYIYEAIAMLLDGDEADQIDEAALSFGMPMGPLELADLIGLDICLDVGRHLQLDEAVSQFLEEKIAAGEAGRKSQNGIYAWEGTAAQRPRARYDDTILSPLSDRFMAPLFAACQACLDEGHVSHPDFVDAAMIHGAGFPAYKGGPQFYRRRAAANQSS